MSNGTVYDLKPGSRYRVRKSIKDCYGGEAAEGTILTFPKRDYLPYHGGHTVTFAEQTLYFQDEQNADILQDLWAYLEALA